MVFRNSFIVKTTFLILVLFHGVSNASDIEYVKRETIGILGDGLDAIRSVSNKYEKAIIDKIQLRVPISPAPVRVRAFKEANSRVIEVSTGYSVIARLIVAGYIMETHLNKPNFGNIYAKYSASTYATGKLGGGKAPWDKAKLSKRKRYLLLTNQDFNVRLQSEHSLVMWYVLSHEIAHHVLNHGYERDMTLTKMREQEAEADTWASNTFIKLGLPPASAFPGLMYWYYLDELGVKNEYRRSHPADLNRIRAMLLKTLNNFDVWNNNTTHMAKISRKKGTNAYKKFLYEVENKISRQKPYSKKTISSKAFKACMKGMYKGCLNVCQNKYGNPLALCKRKLCVSGRTKNINKLKCNDILGG